MNSISYRRLSFLLSITTIAVLESGLSAQAETINTTSSTSAPAPGTTATEANFLAPRLAVPASKASTSTIAQTEPSPGVETTPSTETAPAPTPTETTPAPTPGVETTPTPTETAPAPTAPAPATTLSFTDVSPDYWAYSFIEQLSSRNVIAGFPDGTFRPEQPVNRAEFAAMLQKAFNPTPTRQLSPTGFSDVPTDYWAAPAIRAAYEAGFVDGYPDNTFQPGQQIPKVQAITALANGLNLTATGTAPDILNTYYTDAAQVPSYAINPVAAATQANVVVNYPDVKQLNGQAPLTRAEAAAHLYQALVRLGQVQPLPANVAAANYIVGGRGAVSQTPPTTPAPTTPEETAPTETPPDVDPGRATRGGSSYLGVGANFGLSGDSALGDNVSFTVFSKIGLLNYLSVRPAVMIANDPTIIIPITYDFNPRTADALDRTFSIAPYAGAGVGIKTGDDTSVGFLLSAGLDVPINSRFTATTGVNALFGDDTDVGIWVGVGYNFTGF